MSLMWLRDVHHRFERSGRHVHAVNGVDLDVEAGQTVAVIGESGSGKSTLGRIALGLLTPTSGTVEYGGQGKGPEMQFIFFDEAYRAGAPVSMVTLNTVGPTLIKYGSEE